jgi:hypothetical protein
MRGYIALGAFGVLALLLKARPKESGPEPLRPLGGAARLSLWGPVDWSEGEGRAIDLDPAWARQNIRTEHVPELGRNLTMHREFFGPFRAWLKEAKARGLVKVTDDIQASWNPRLTSSLTYPSSHAYGTAFDYEPARYPEGHHPPDKKIQELASIAAKYGIAWGGLIREPHPDNMHFELIRRG